jgi:hypothetical protein
VQCRRVAALGRCAGVVVCMCVCARMCVDACDARGDVTTPRLGCQTSSCSVAVGVLCCVARVLSVAAAAIAGSPCCALVRHVSFDRACRSRSVAMS